MSLLNDQTPAPEQKTDTPPPPKTDAAPPADKPWYGDFQNADVREWVSKIGAKSPEAVAQKAWYQEKMIGAEKAGRTVVVPKADAPAAEWEQVYARLGRPDKPEDYGIKLAEGADTSMIDAALPQFHKLGLTKAQASGLVEWWNGYAESAGTKSAEISQQQASAEIRQLQQDWGKEFPTRLEVAKRGVAEMGLDAAQAQKIEEAIGPRAAALMFEKMGRPAMEAAMHRGEVSKFGFGMTPAEAREKIAALKSDKEWAAKYLSGSASARDEMTRLMKLAYE